MSAAAAGRLSFCNIFGLEGAIYPGEAPVGVAKLARMDPDGSALTFGEIA